MTYERGSYSKLEKLRHTFDTLDRDKDGYISASEFVRVLGTQTARNELDEEQRQTIMRRIDNNLNTRFDFDEFAITATSTRAEPRASRRFLYRVADTVTPVSNRAYTHSYLSSYNCCPPPIGIILISIAEIAVFIGYSISSGLKPGWLQGCAGCWVGNKPGPLLFAPPLREEAWRFLSYIFLHAGIEHLLGNIIMQVVIGIPLELVHKFWRIMPLYFLGAIMGAMLQYSLDPTTYLVGASGGVYALITAHLANLIINWNEMPGRLIRLLTIGLFVGLDVGHALYRYFALTDNNKISYAAHLGGAITGALLGIILLKNVVPIKWETVLGWFAVGLFVLLFIACAVVTGVTKPYGVPFWQKESTGTNAP